MNHEKSEDLEEGFAAVRFKGEKPQVTRYEKSEGGLGNSGNFGPVKDESMSERFDRELMEKLADIEHERWSDWHKYMINNQTLDNIVRWAAQSVTPFEHLSEREKESDRREVRRYADIIKAFIEREVAAAQENWSQCNSCFDTIHCGKCKCCKYAQEGAAAMKQQLVSKILKLSEDIEAQQDTSIEEWRGFKRFRNQLRDMLDTLPLSENTDSI